jgi:hypothetical protein
MAIDDEEARLREGFEERQERKRQEFEARLEKQKATREWLMLIITVAAVLAGAWTAYEARHARIEAAQAAKDSLSTQQQSVNAQIEAMQLDERPFVVVQSGDWSIRRGYSAHKVVGLVPTVSYRIAVRGKTPAMNIYITAICTLDEQYQTATKSPSPKADFLSQFLSEGDSPGYFLDGLRVRQGAQPRLRFVGELSYSDYFQKLHHSPFCFRNSLPISKTVLKGNLIPCEKELQRLD